ncbi:MAG: hypothetical protein CSA64_03900 [Arachnia propionica]|nr:MAG: hypothetical protein CSA64_03900 [Arachnia propionica]
MSQPQNPWQSQRPSAWRAPQPMAGNYLRPPSNTWQRTPQPASWRAPQQPFPQRYPAPATPQRPLPPYYRPSWQKTPTRRPTNGGGNGALLLIIFVSCALVLGALLLKALAGMVSDAASPTTQGPAVPSEPQPTTAPTGQPTNVWQPDDNYQHQSLPDQPSAAPQPTTLAEANQLLLENPLYGVAVPASFDCPAGVFPDAAAGSLNAYEGYINAYIGCLTQVWQPSLAEAGWAATQPEIFAYEGGSEITTECGTVESQNAFFCAADQMIYVAKDVLEVLPGEGSLFPLALDTVVSHEFGHFVQHRSGILVSSQIFANEATTESEQLQFSRRDELQADCFAGIAARSLAASRGLSEADVASTGVVLYELGDDRLGERYGYDPGEGDHGSGQNRQRWADIGATADLVGACNTYVAADDDIA